MVDELAGRLPESSVRTGQRVTHLASLNAGGPPFQVKTEDGGRYRADAVVLATPADVSATLVRGVDADLAADLETIRFVSTAVVSLGYGEQTGSAEHPLNGFGFLIPKSEGRRITACTWTSTKFDHRARPGRQLIRCFIGGPGRETEAEQDDETLTTVVKAELRDIMGIAAEPEMVQIHRWYKANPQYDINHLDKVAAMRQRTRQHGRLLLAGCSYDGVGVPDCIRQGQEAADEALALLNGNGGKGK
jgi:oxygen-dependent protoporphyrinogen oxidase